MIMAIILYFKYYFNKWIKFFLIHFIKIRFCVVSKLIYSMVINILLLLQKVFYTSIFISYFFINNFPLTFRLILTPKAGCPCVISRIWLDNWLTLITNGLYFIPISIGFAILFNIVNLDYPFRENSLNLSVCTGYASCRIVWLWFPVLWQTDLGYCDHSLAWQHSLWTLGHILFFVP